MAKMWTTEPVPIKKKGRLRAAWTGDYSKPPTDIKPGVHIFEDRLRLGELLHNAALEAGFESELDYIVKEVKIRRPGETYPPFSSDR